MASERLAETTGYFSEAFLLKAFGILFDLLGRAYKLTLAKRSRFDGFTPFVP
jgi:hypothetical protein